MLKLYYGRADRDKDRFLFDRIGEQLNNIKNPGEERVLLIVPDQFTLQAERNAFEHLEAEGLMDIDIMSHSRLGAKVLNETGGLTRAHVDKYGRHMLLAKVTSEAGVNLVAFKGLSQKHAFLTLVNDLISEMKQYNISPEDIAVIQAALPAGSILSEKLNDIHKIYTGYEEMIRGKYTDTEDYLDLFVSKISQSKFIEGADIWIDGFDYYTPKTLAIIDELMKSAKNLHIIMTLDPGNRRDTGEGQSQGRDADLFTLTEKFYDKFRTIALESGSKFSAEALGPEYAIRAGFEEDNKAGEMIHLEKQLYAYPYKPYEKSQTSALQFCQCSNFYTETETVAANITDLVREGGMRYRDIVVICNDIENRASIIRRTFEDYEIPYFIDQKRTIMHNPCIEYISALMDIIAGGWRYEDVFRLIKTGLTDIQAGDYEKLENYAYKYKIKGNRWKSEFKFGRKDEGDEALSLLNQTRLLLITLISDFEKGFQNAKTVKAKTILLYDFLDQSAAVPKGLITLTDYLIAHEAFDFAEEMQQIWDVIVNMLDQLVLLIGETEITVSGYSELMKTGFETVEIGILPPTIDQVIVGTMQRTRTGPVKALFVMGANDGVLPAANRTEGILSDDEKSMLLKRSIEIGKSDDFRAQEENLAIYRTLSKPSRLLWMGYAASDLDGREIRQSTILDKMRRLFPNTVMSKDILNSNNPMLLVSNGQGTLRHMTDELRNGYENGKVDKVWKAAYNWFKERSKHTKEGDQAYGRKLAMMRDGMLFDNKVDRLGLDLIKRLYGKSENLDLTLSPSRLERFSKCPFAYFIDFGLKAEERKIFEVTGREMGDIYHECLKRLSSELTLEGLDITAPESPWMKISEEECSGRIHQMVSEMAKEYREGILESSQAEEYRQQRIKSVCSKTAWMMIDHVQKGKIRRSFFEAGFGRGDEKSIPAIEILLQNERLYIEGIIDRIDVLSQEGNEEAQATANKDYVKIIDYKSGTEQFDLAEVLAGWRLQLMLYLKAAGNGLAAKPAGAFYFKIDETLMNASLPINASLEEMDFAREKLSAAMKKKYKMDGVVLNDKRVLDTITGDFSGYSDIIPISKNKDGEISAPLGKLLTEEEFADLQSAVDETVEKLCGELISGSLDITPKRVKADLTACTFCSYKAICCFDLSFEGCKYINVN